MKVGMYYNNSDVKLEEMPIPKIGDNDILLKIMSSGICGTDIMEWYRIKKAPMVQGHEVAGTIEEVGKNIKDYKIGDRIFATHHVPCETCRDCLRGNKTSCSDFQKVNNFSPGGFSEYIKITGKSIDTGIIKLPEEMSYDEATFIEPLGTLTEKIKITSGDTVLVLGSGVAGILNIQYAKAFGADKIIATDISPLKLEYAKKFGADYAINAKEYSPELLKEINNGRLADQVIVCASSKAVMEQALNSFDNGGIVTIFATPKQGEKVEIDFFEKWRTGFRWEPTYGAPPLACSKAFYLIKNKKINVKDMITHKFPLEEIAEGFITASKGEGLKVIINPHKD